MDEDPPFESGPEPETETEPEIKSLGQLRKELKALGYRMTTERLSIGRHATYHLADGSDSLTYNVGAREQWDRWGKLREWQRDNRASLEALSPVPGTGGMAAGGEEAIYGLMNLIDK